MSRFSKAAIGGSCRTRTTKFTVARPKSSAGMTWLGEQHPKNGVDRAQQAISQFRFLGWLHRIDIRGSEDIDARKTGGKEGLLGLSLNATPSRKTSRSDTQIRHCMHGMQCMHVNSC